MKIEKQPFEIKPVNKKLLKSSKVRAYFKEVTKIVKKNMEAGGSAWGTK